MSNSLNAPLRKVYHVQHMLVTNDQFTKVAISSLGGVGKTQLVPEILYHLREKDRQFSAIWIQATTMESPSEPRIP